MKYPALLAIGAFLMWGCNRKAETPAPQPTSTGQTAAQPTAQPQQPPPNYVKATAENQPVANASGEVNAYLTEQLNIFIQQKKRLPESFTELAQARLDSVPRPPQGKKWVIDTSTRQVKAVLAQ
jgi:hypothetical protein